MKIYFKQIQAPEISCSATLLKLHVPAVTAADLWPFGHLNDIASVTLQMKLFENGSAENGPRADHIKSKRFFMSRLITPESLYLAVFL